MKNKYNKGFAAITTLLVVAGLFVGAFFLFDKPAQAPVFEPTLGATIPTPIALFETSLASSISSSATTMTLVSGTDKDGTALAGSTYGFIIDEGSSNEEFVLATCTSTACTSMTRGISVRTGNTEVTALKKAHGRGASVKITDAPVLLTLARILNGNETIPNAIAYANGVGPVASSDLADKEYVLSVVTGGSITADKIIIAGNAGETVAAGNILYRLNTDTEWYKTDADASATSENVLLGIAQGSGTNGNAISGGVLIYGLDTNQTSLSTNTIYYVSNTAGALSSSAGTKEVTVGQAKSTTSIEFTPGFNQNITEDEQDAISGGSVFGTPSSTNKFLTQDWLNSSAVVRFGGTGADGALNVTSGTTTVSCASANVCILNYTTINVSSGATLAFSNPASDGTVVILKATSTVTIAGTVDVRGMGGAATTTGFGILGTEVVAGQNATTSAGVAGAAFSTNKKLYTKSANSLVSRTTYIYAGSGGGSGGEGDAPNNAAGGTGGRGGGGILIESRGALNFSGTINTSGTAGSNGANGTSSSGGGGGGGGGSAGTIVVLYNSLTANSGTMTSTGAAGGSGGNGTGGDCSGQCHGGGGAGSYTGAGAAGEANASNAGSGGGGGLGNPNGSGGAGGTAGATESGLVAPNLNLF